jgi:hypothetical protein
MKTLFAVMGAEKLIENGMHDLIRNTWAKDCAPYGDFRFFVGQGEAVLTPDTIRVDAPDDKDNLIYKVVAMCRWALDNGYDRMLKTDIDTFVNVPLVMQQDLDYDWIGTNLGALGEKYGDTGAWSFIQGSAMWLSRKSMEIVAKEALINMIVVREELMRANGIISPYPHSEDLWIAQVLGPRLKDGELRARADTSYSNGPLTYHFAICHSTCSQDEWNRRLVGWFSNLNQGNYEYHQSR